MIKFTDEFVSNFKLIKGVTQLPEIDTSELTNAIDIFSGTSIESIPNLNTSKVENMSYFCCQCDSLKSVGEMDTSRVKDMTMAFAFCTSLHNIDWPIDMSNCETCSGMFRQTPIKQPIKLKNVPKKLNLNKLEAPYVVLNYLD